MCVYTVVHRIVGMPTPGGKIIKSPIDQSPSAVVAFASSWTLALLGCLIGSPLPKCTRALSVSSCRVGIPGLFSEPCHRKLLVPSPSRSLALSLFFVGTTRSPHCRYVHMRCWIDNRPIVRASSRRADMLSFRSTSGRPHGVPCVAPVIGVTR